VINHRVVVLTHDKVKADSLKGESANHSHYRWHFEDNVEVLWLPEDSSAVMLGRLIPGYLSPLAVALADEVLRKIKPPITNRFAVAGKGSAVRRRKKDGTLSRTTEVPDSVQKLIGYSDVVGWLPKDRRTPRGRLSTFTRLNPIARPLLRHALNEIDGIVSREFMDDFEEQGTSFASNGIRNFHDDYEGSAFSSCYGNHEVTSAYHHDGRNADLSALFTTGSYEGGGLVLPEFRVCFHLQPRDLLLFNGNIMHGVLPYKGNRNSAVFFAPARPNVTKCYLSDEEADEQAWPDWIEAL
jgi:hypothetical protein